MLGNQVLPHVENVLARKVPLETRQRLEALQTQLLGPLSGDHLRQVRAIEVLERIGNAESRELLQALAGGAPGALQTREATSSLQRMTKS